MAVNWKRGLICAWIVVSALWLLIALPMMMVLYSGFEETRAASEIPGASRIEYVRLWNWPPWQVVAGTIAVPLVLFGVGAAMYWTASGFRSQRPQLEPMGPMARESYLDEVRRNLQESLELWSNQNKPERERSVVRAFFRCLGVSFVERDLVVAQAEPVDVAALSARFQVTEIIDRDRQRHKEYRQRLKRAEAARSAADLREPWTNPVPVSSFELSAMIVSRLRSKTAHADIDALVYVNLRGRFLTPTFEASAVSGISALGWRSVSVVFIPYALVLHATAAAPEFLRRAVGNPQSGWDRPDGWFERGA